jgi:hypothetical protein
LWVRSEGDFRQLHRARYARAAKATNQRIANDGSTDGIGIGYSGSDGAQDSFNPGRRRIFVNAGQCRIQEQFIQSRDVLGIH